MNAALVDQIVNAVLYEGYILYPYRASSKKNQRGRFTFGRVYPQAFNQATRGVEPCLMQTECLMRLTVPAPTLEVTIRFLQPLSPTDPTGWQKAAERKETLSVRLPANIQHTFQIDSLKGLIEIYSEPAREGLSKITIRIRNLSPASAAELHDAETILPRTFASTHTILHIEGGEFISAVDPASHARCHNIGTWPVLVGDEAKGERDTLLSSPIILSDYPAVAPESTNNFFDGTEIDEMLTLRIQTMTDAEKIEMRAVDEHARRLLERVESLADDPRMTMYGVLRDKPPESVEVNGVRLNRGSRVRIRPKARADAMDLVLAGRTAEVEAVEQDAEGKFHLALVLTDDPGKDLGLMRQIGHRFFYGTDEVEPLRGDET
jgi:hypothetical protein